MGWKKCCVQKNVWYQKDSELKNCEARNILGSKQFRVQENVRSKKFWVQQLLVQKLLGSKKCWIWKKGDVDIMDCEAFWAVIFFKNAQTFWFFDIVGGMCAFLKCQSFRTQLKLLSVKFLLPSCLESTQNNNYYQISEMEVFYWAKVSTREVKIKGDLRGKYSSSKTG